MKDFAHVAYGPKVPACDFIHAEKYRMRGEDFRSAMTRVASALADNEEHFDAFREILLAQRFMPGGRIQAAVGSTKAITPYNCFVSGTIEDSFVDGTGSIMERAKQAALTMRLGGGIGYDFSTLRPRGELIRKLQSESSGSVSFLEIFDAIGRATASSGHRRGAQMGVLRVDHPDIEEFIRAKQNEYRLTGFNLSVGITNEFMHAVKSGREFRLRHNGKEYHSVNARVLWDSIMRSTYDWSEPGVLFIDNINLNNNLYYCESIAATNPCGEQPLPPYGACLLGSLNLTKYLQWNNGKWWIDTYQIMLDVPHIVRAMDKVIDIARYPLYEQEQEAQSKRRMGIGLTGVANAIEATGHPYGSDGFCSQLESIFEGLRNNVYRASIELAREKGPFPLYRATKYQDSRFIQRLPDELQSLLALHGIRNSHLLSIAPTGTISFAADNISSGIEPVYAHKVRRSVNSAKGPKIVELSDYGVSYLETYGRTVEECATEDHLRVLAIATEYVDSAVSKTINVPSNITWDDFKSVYIRAFELGAKGCTTYRPGGKRSGVIESAEEPQSMSDPVNACEISGRGCE
jgi:ribonucleoside-diphosphate reductase alpha chain